jgi:hypothetical protein
VIYSGAPDAFGSWGIVGAIKCSYRQAPPDIQPADHPTIPPGEEQARVAFAIWNSSLHKLDVVEHGPATAEAASIDTTSATPIWQLGKGWYGPENGFRWIAPEAQARLGRPAGATKFALRALITSTLLDSVGPVTVHISIGDRDLEPRRVTQPGWQTLDWPLAPAAAGPVQISIRTEPPFRPAGDPRTLGIAIGDFGFSSH